MIYSLLPRLVDINHNGAINIAKKLIDMAIRCGADAVKFQKRVVEKCYPKELLDSPHESPWGSTYRDEKLGREFGQEEYNEIDSYCLNKIPWFASAWDLDSLEFLKQYDLKYNKVASPVIHDKDLIIAIAREGKHTFVSTGCINGIDELRDVVDIFENYDCPITIMHCIYMYPCPIEKCGVSYMEVLKRHFPRHPVGYSCHHPGILPSVVAMSLGATVIEKHITLDRAMYGKDQPASLEEHGLGQIVKYANNVRLAL